MDDGKIIPRWCSKLVANMKMVNIGTHNRTNDKSWTSSECKSEVPFFPFCSVVSLPDKSIMVMGGLNDQVEGRKTFSSKVLKITEK